MRQLKSVRFGVAAHAERIAEAAGTTYNPVVDQCISCVNAKDQLLGGVIYKDYTGPGGSITAHTAGFNKRWVNEEMLWVCFDYPFNQLKVKKMWGQVPASNQKALKFNKSLGFEVEQVIKDVYPDGDMNLMSMYREQCRYLEPAEAT
jgi:RimJ/RimL family protein N-acetyltransferase